MLTKLRPPAHTSWIQAIALMPRKERNAFIKSLNQEERNLLYGGWVYNARLEQLPPEYDDWSVWLIKAGRGWGKTRTGAEWLIQEHKQAPSGTVTGIIAATVEDLRRYCIRGASGILSVAPNAFYPDYQPSQTRLVWPNNTETLLFSSEKPDRIRGPNLSKVWADELASWKYMEETWDNMEFALRDSDDPQVVVTTTPKPRKLLRDLIKDPETVLTNGTTYDNAANLSMKFIQRIKRKYEGTQKGSQEIYAELLDEAEGALWKRVWFDNKRIREQPELIQEAVAIDPAAKDTESSDETGIIAGGITDRRHGVVTEDLSGRYSPDGWARQAILSYHGLPPPNDKHLSHLQIHGERRPKNYIVAENNNGGDMVKHTIETTAKEMHRNGQIPTAEVVVKMVWASKGKVARAEPVSSMYERGEISHLGTFSALEDQCCTYEPNSGQRSPDRYDGLVWLFTKLLVESQNIDLTAAPIGIGRENYYHGI